MAGKTRLKKALPAVVSHFEGSPKKVFSRVELTELLESMRKEWGLPEGLWSKVFIDQLVTLSVLRIVEIKSNGSTIYTQPKLERYVYGNVSPFEVALSIRSNSHLSHSSSMFLSGLTEQIPKNIYVTFEQSMRPAVDKTNISQDLIDNAFSKPQKVPSGFYTYLDYKITLLSSKFSKQAGIIKINSIYGRDLHITNTERTLIDITVRPLYAGGVTEILKAYERASDILSVNKLSALLRKLDFVYPYHQAIGFYLEKCGKYKQKQIDMMRSEEMKFDFYLTYNIKEKSYSKHWRLYYPKNL